MQVIYEDNHLLVVVKPPRMPMVPDRSGDLSLLDMGKEYIRRTKGKKGRVFLAVVHRIDRPVSGVVCFARTSKAASRLSAQLRERRFAKAYLAMVEGRPRKAHGIIDLPLKKDRRRNLVSVDTGPSAKPAVTCWERLYSTDQRSLLLLVPVTGRSHQLRVHCAAMGHPLVGDVKYGGRRETGMEGWIALHSLNLSLAHPISRNPLGFWADPPRAGCWMEMDRKWLLV